MKVPVKDKSNWFRDSNGGSIQCADQTVYQKYMKAHKAEELKKQGFTFDIGPSWYWMPDIFEKFF